MSTLPSTKPLTCKVCRQRKVRCDGEKPACGPCLRGRKVFTCEYLDPSAPASPELPKGAACIPCWKRKRKCDGNRPCQTCKNTAQPDACQYREKVQRRKPLDEENIRKKQASSSEEASGSSKSSPSTSPPPQDLDQPESTENGNFDPPLETQTCQDIDRAAELSLVRNLFLQQSWEYGLHISAAKRAAIACGDPSGTVVHPALIAVSELHGYTLAKNSGSATYAYLKGHWDTREAARLARVLSLLDTPTDRGAPDPLTCVQVYKLLALYYLRQKKGFHGYAEYLGQASDIALRHQALLGLDKSAPTPPAPIGSGFPLGAVEEGRSTLAHLVYLEVAVGVIRKLPPLLPAAMIAKFERFADNVAGETELNVVRAKTVIYLQESEKLVDEWNTDEAGGIVGSEWADRWIAISKRLHAHLFTLRTAIAEHLSVHHVAVLILKSCVVITLASMAILHAVFAPFYPFAWQRHSCLLNSIAQISRTFVPEDHQYFDCTLALCWDIASREILKPPSVSAPQWKVSFADVVFMGYNEPLELDLCTGSTVTDSSQVTQPLEQPLEFSSLSL
ncbi:hypothetical protein DFH06DRAFT_1184297 [Mycena polygramma]|nr:hypothetical protein DFH06DRAFT_1184297 [Mycena polygramma]